MFLPNEKNLYRTENVENSDYLLVKDFEDEYRKKEIDNLTFHLIQKGIYIGYIFFTHFFKCIFPYVASRHIEYMFVSVHMKNFWAFRLSVIV